MIYCSRHALEGYKRRAAQAFPKEYLELLFGQIEKGEIHIRKSVFVPQIGCKQWVRPRGSNDDYEHRIACGEAKTGLDFVGTIHSHTLEGLWQMPSYADHHEANEWEEPVFLIDHITRKGKRCFHEITFWKPQQPLDTVSYF